MNKKVGVIGGGQLASMMGLEAEALGIDLIVQTPHQDDPAVTIATEVIYGAIDDVNATKSLANSTEVITFENEFVNIDGLIFLSKEGTCFRPSLSSLSPLLDKYDQRCYFASQGLPVPKFKKIDCFLDLDSGFGYPVVLKARRHGYDGQGTFIIKNQQQLYETYKSLENTPLLLEEFVPFTQELAVIAARGTTGEIAVYPVVETQQEHQVCRRVFAPAAIPLSVTLQVKTITRTLLEKLQFIGVLGIELFLTSENKVLINEIAPRTHNSGHYTLDACVTSQFEMQLRAVTGLPLGDPSLKFKGAVMVNLLGYENRHHDYNEKRQLLSKLPDTYVHWYGKSEARPGRKLGHVTVVIQNDAQDPQAIAEKIEDIWYPSH